MKNSIVSPQNREQRWLKRASRIAVRSLFAGVVISCIAAGPYPEPLSNRKDIRAAKPTLDSIDIWNLPLAEYSLLSKFTGLKRIRLYSREGTFATDEKMKALSDIGFTNVTYINLNNARLVTDEGIRSLSKLCSLKELTLEGTAITDVACDVMASQMALTSLNIANCIGVTKKGLEELAQSKTLNYFSFSCDKLTQTDALTLIDSFNSITWCEIIDPARKLDVYVIKNKGAEKKIHLTVRPTGALQDMRLRP
jgi:hypothetical protein